MELINSKAIIQSAYQRLKHLKDSKKRGFEFEKLIKALLEMNGLAPKGAYEAAGEQIDGSFFWQGQTVLLEAKWTKDPLPVSSIYSFKGKLDGKFHTTIGVFISVSGFSADVDIALKFEKTLNILLFDGSDVDLLFNGEVEFIEMLLFKLREAGDTGSLYVPYNTRTIARKISESKPVYLSMYSSLESPIMCED